MNSAFAASANSIAVLVQTHPLSSFLEFILLLVGVFFLKVTSMSSPVHCYLTFLSICDFFIHFSLQVFLFDPFTDLYSDHLNFLSSFQFSLC